MRFRMPAILTAAVMLGLAGFSDIRQQQTCDVTLRLTDAVRGKPLAGLIRVTDEEGEPVAVQELLSRGTGLAGTLPISRWFVLPGEKTVALPRKKLTIEAVSGLETELAKTTVDLSDKTSHKLTLALPRFYNAAARGYRSANTHLHLQKLTREGSDRYLHEIPRADDLDGLFVSYLERAVADREYISNEYTDADLAKFAERTGVLFGNGEEHRHNFTGFGEGYGHVMLLNIKKLIQPVSIGPGIMKMGTDGIPLQRGIDTARGDGAAVIWCHNNWGMEEVPNLLAGRIDAQNIFDGGTHGSFKDSYYRFLNAGIAVPFSTGTDWFMYDFSRVYCAMEGDVTIEKWLQSLAAGKSYITNGPLLEFSVDGKTMGETVSLENRGSVEIRAAASGRADFLRIELVQNGEVVARQAAEKVDGHYEAEMTLELPVDAPCWLALRTPPPSVPDDPELNEPVNRNVLGRELFAHTSAVGVEVAGRQRFDPAVAQELLAEMQASRKKIAATGQFADDQERARVLDVYADGIAVLEERIRGHARESGGGR